MVKMYRLLCKVICRFKKNYFRKRFGSFPIDSGIGRDGSGKGCIVSGADRIYIGADCYFGEGTELVALANHFDQQLRSNMRIGDHVRCVGGCRITCAGSIKIEDDVLLGPGVFITDHNHGMDPQVPGGYSKQSLIVKDVLIGNGAWLGQRVCIMPGVSVGDHSIIGANSLVTHDIPPYSIAVGAPARIVKKWNMDTKTWEPVYSK